MCFQTKGRIISTLEILENIFLFLKDEKFLPGTCIALTIREGNIKNGEAQALFALWHRKLAQHTIYLADSQTGSVFEGSVVLGPFV